ncbi:MAG: PocR ligand-binding domain-containing protein, partial [Methanosarcinales archaeon]
MSQTASLQELVDLNELQAIQDSLAKTVGTSSVIFSPEGEPLTQFSNLTGFCSLIQSTEEGKRRCFLSFREMSQKALELEEPVIQYCFAHGGHFVAPIIIDGKHKGTMFAGQFIPQKFSVEQLKALEKIAVEIHVDPNLLVEEAKKMRVVEEDTVWNYSSLLFQIVAVITRLGAQADELNRAKDALQNAHDELEIRVQERTAELAKTNADLRLFSQAVDSSIEGISVGDLEGRITYVNKAFAKMFGYSSEELMGKEIALIYSEDQPPKLEKALEATMDGGWIGELVGKRKDGQLFPIAVSASQIK